jgi:hypothetical protein
VSRSSRVCWPPCCTEPVTRGSTSVSESFTTAAVFNGFTELRDKIGGKHRAQLHRAGIGREPLLLNVDGVQIKGQPFRDNTAAIVGGKIFTKMIALADDLDEGFYRQARGIDDLQM